jgi:hypothetical protein
MAMCVELGRRPPAMSETGQMLAQRRDSVGADIGIVARKHRRNASTRRSNLPTAKPRCRHEPCKELLAAKAERSMNV